MDLVDEVDVLSLWPSAEQKALASSKWAERRDSLQSLLDILTANPRPAADADYSGIIGQLKMVLLKDSNVFVMALAAQVIHRLAEGLGPKFGRYATTLAPAIFEKFKEKKETLRKPLAECAIAVAATTPPEKLLPAINDALQKPNPNIKIEIGHLIYKLVKLYDSENRPTEFLRESAKLGVKLSDDAAPDVREAGMAALGSIHRLVGDAGAKALFGAAFSDAKKQAKISEWSSKATAEVAEERRALGVFSDANGVKDGETADGSSGAGDSRTGEGSAVDVDPWDLLEPTDAINKLPKEFYELLVSKKWSDRKDALDTLAELLKPPIKLQPSPGTYKPLVTDLRKLLDKDVNVNVCAAGAKALMHFALGLRTSFADFAPECMAACLERLKEKKPVLRDPLIECVDQLALTTPLEAFLPQLVTALGKPNPQIRQQSVAFICRLFNKHGALTIPKAAIKELAPVLTKLGSDPDAEVREATYVAIGTIVRCIGEQSAGVVFGDLFADGIKKGKIDAATKDSVEKIGQKAAPEVIRLYGTSGGAAAAPQKRPASAKPTRNAPASAKPQKAASAPRNAIRSMPTTFSISDSTRPTTTPARSSVGSQRSATAAPARDAPTRATPVVPRTTSATTRPPPTAAARPAPKKAPMITSVSAHRISPAPAPTPSAAAPTTTHIPRPGTAAANGSLLRQPLQQRTKSLIKERPATSQISGPASRISTLKAAASTTARPTTGIPRPPSGPSNGSQLRLPKRREPSLVKNNP